jgi:hypothetical protein
VPVPSEVMAAVMQGEAASNPTAHPADVKSAHSANAAHTHSAEMGSAPSAEVASSEPGGVPATESAACVPAAESTACVPAAESTAPVASAAAAAAAARFCRGCNGAAGKRAGEENDHRFFEHHPVPLLVARLHRRLLRSAQGGVLSHCGFFGLAAPCSRLRRSQSRRRKARRATAVTQAGMNARCRRCEPFTGPREIGARTGNRRQCQGIRFHRAN